MGKQKGHLVVADDPNDDVAIKVEGVSKSFRLPHNRQNSIKGSLINLVSRGDRTFETQELLKDISFDIKKGEFFGIVGRNGSGKSTLLKMLAGIYTPTSGKIIVNGSLTPFIELGVGFNPELTGRENVFLNGALLGFNEKDVSAMYDDIVAFAELERFMDQKLKNYSSGMQVRLAFSIAIRAQSDILLIDEVLAVGDAAFQQKCYSYFEALKRQRKTVVLVTHDMSAAERFCTRAMLIERGVIKTIGASSGVADTYREENITNTAAGTDEKASVSKYSLDIVVENDGATNKRVSFSHTYPLGAGGYYIGLTLFRDGVNVAEINSSGKRVKQDTLTYILDTSSINPGVYEVSGALFRTSDKALLAVCNDRKSFIVKGKDATRGGALKLKSNWV
jgi:ABC-type polysaccharide/polyol phosphate transport system ATPase subunit